MFMFEFPNTIPLLLFVSLIIFASLELNNIGDSAFPGLRPIFTVAGPDATFTLPLP